jgi:hypothetical protein
VRIAEAQLGAQPDGVEELDDPRVDLRPAGKPVQPERLADDLPARHPRIERRVGILEDDVHPAPVRAQVAPGEIRDVGAVQPDRPIGRLVETVDAVADGRLAAAGLPDEAEDLSRGDRERDAVDGVDDPAGAAHAAAEREVLHEPFDLQDRLLIGAHRSPGWKQATT